MDNVLVRRAVPDDSVSILYILRSISAQRIYTAIDQPWSEDEQRRYISNLSAREAVHVAEAASGAIIGYQTLELWAPTLNSMAHVGQIGTFVASEWQRQGIAAALFRTTLQFARTVAFAKFVIQVRSMNTGAQAFYRGVGFRECGRLRKQVRIGGDEDDEILMELFI